MNRQLDHAAATYAPQTFKTFAGALGAFFQHECPALGGERTRLMLVRHIMEMIERFYPETSRMGPGQIQWTTVHKDAKAAYGKRISDTPLQSVVLDLVRPEDAAERAAGKKLRQVKKEAVGRLFTQAFEQDGVLTNAEVAILLKVAPTTVGKYAREVEQETDHLLPRRGVIHDLGPTLTHKKEIIRKLFMEAKSVGQVQRETDHSPEAIHRYIQAFKQVWLCRRKGLSLQETAFALKMSPRLILEYHRLLDAMQTNSTPIEKLLQIEAKDAN